MATGAIIARIITQYSAKGSKQAQKDITKLGKDFDKFAKKSALAFAAASAAVGAFAFKVGTDAGSRIHFCAAGDRTRNNPAPLKTGCRSGTYKFAPSQTAR